MPSQREKDCTPTDERLSKRLRLNEVSTATEDVIQRLCTACRDILCQKKGPLEFEQDWGRSFSHHSKFADLRGAATRSCFFCGAIWRSFSSSEQGSLLDLDDAGLNEYIDSGSEYAWDGDETLNSLRSATRVDLIRASKSQYDQDRQHKDAIIVSLSMSFEARLMCTFIDERENARFLLRPIPATDSGTASVTHDTSSLQVWKTAEQWMAKCDAYHSCVTSSQCDSSEKWYPTRLLDVLAKPGLVRLVETAKEPVHGTYVTLSHRWGTHRPMILCDETSVRLGRGVNTSELPKAFQDAVLVCQRLSRYIWIDSLCIQQDSRDDWLREASLMHKVYSNSYLNISALAASDSSETFFRDRAEDPLDDLILKTKLNGELKLGSADSTYRATAQSFWVQGVDCAHLNRRGWVLQERLLSPRVLHFGPSQLYWECNHAQAAEKYPTRLPRDLLPMQSAFKNSLASNQPGSASSDLSTAAAHRDWYTAVESYSMSGLTKSEDKLLAIAGVAKRIKNRIDDDYICGMWRRTLVQDLCWRAHHRNVPGAATRPFHYRAPTFSWASLDTHIVPYTPLGPPDYLIEVLDTSIELATVDTTGLVIGGRLTIKCHLQSVSFGSNTASEPFMIINNDESYSVPGWTIHGEQKPTLHLDEGLDTFNPIGQTGIFCFPVLSCKSEDITYPQPISNVITIVHLLVELDHDSKDFRRIGVSHTRIGDPDEEEMQAWLASRSEQDLPLAQDEEGWHTINII